MQGQTKVMWDFLETAFRTGTLDELLNLIHVVSGEEDQDMSQKFADLEEWFLERDDFTSVDQTFEKIYALMEGLTDNETMEGIGILFSFVSPLISTVMEKVRADGTLSTEIQLGLEEKVTKVFNALKAIVGLGVKMYFTSLGEKPARQIGYNLGRSLNSVSGFINGMQGDDGVNVVPDFMSGIFSSIDGDAVGKMAETLTDGFLDQKPPIFKWTAATAAKRAKKRLLKR